MLIVCGKANYTNLSRYSELCERTYRYHYSRGIGFEAVNQQLIEQHGSRSGVQIGVVDCTFSEKSGRHTPRLDWFYNGKTQKTEKGLEWSVISIVDLDQHTGYSLSAQQTEAGLAARAKAAQEESQSIGNRVDFYLGHLTLCTARWIGAIPIFVASNGEKHSMMAPSFTVPLSGPLPLSAISISSICLKLRQANVDISSCSPLTLN